MGEQAFDIGSAETSTKTSRTVMEQVVAAAEVVDSARLARLEAIEELDRTQVYGYDGYTSTSTFLIHRCGMGSGEANREVFLARSLPEMPYSTKSATAGTITVSQLLALAHGRSRHPEQYRADEVTLEEAIGGLDLADTRRLIDYWCQAHDEPGEMNDPEPSRLFLSRTLGGRGDLAGDLDPESTELLETALDTLISEMVRHTPAGELEPAPVRRAEALDELMRRYLDSRQPAVDHGTRPHLTVVVDWKVLAGTNREGVSQFLGGGIITPEDARRLACDAAVCRLLMGPDGEILDLGSTTRTVTPAQWKALRIRDAHCRFPGCRRPPSWCDAHHIDPWAVSRRTDLNNLVLLCRHHHTLVHRRGWLLEGTPEDLRFTRPDGTPLANGPP